MIIDSVHIKNFRSILDETLYCEQLTALVGANGSGKSSFLYAIDLFYNSSPKVTKEDFYGEDTSVEIIIAVTFKELVQEEEIFSNYIQGGKLKVERVFIWNDGKITAKYHGFSLRNREFNEIRAAFKMKDRGKRAKELYESLRSTSEYIALPPWTTSKDCQLNLEMWEEENTDKCERIRDEGQFFGFTEVAQGYLGKYTRFLFIPAVKDASNEASDGRGSIITALMDLVVRSVLAKKEALKELRESTEKKYKEIMEPSKLPELKALEKDMSTTLKTFVPNAGIDLKWLNIEKIDIPPPKVEVKLIEDGYKTDVVRTGHGLQRAFILTMLQHLALAQLKGPSTDEEDDKSKEDTIDTKQNAIENQLPNLLLAIEEPELYQHPNRQRHLAKILMQLAYDKIPGVAEKTQIIYCTHSPLFVGIDRIEQIRLLRKVENTKEEKGFDFPKITKIFSTTLDEVANTIWDAEGKPTPKYTGQTLLPRLQTIMTPWMNEGFFADIAVLVEGEDDRASILGIAKAKGFDLEGNGFSIIPCIGKNNINRPYVIFHKLGIPLYIIWDGDYGKGETAGKCEKCGKALDGKPDPKENHRLLNLVGKAAEDWPAYIEDTFACFKTNLETTLIDEIGAEKFEEYLKKYQLEYGIAKRKHAIKNPNIITSIILNARSEGKRCNTLENIVDKIWLLKHNGI